MPALKAVIIIPTYNEKENVSRLIPAIVAVCATIPHWEWHILVVDDSSPDQTALAVEALSNANDHVHLLRNEKKAGLGAAYLVGMKMAIEQLGADVVFEMDADFSHDPAKLPEFVAAIDAGSDLVIGSRYIKGGSIPANWGWERKFLSVVGNWINKLILWNFAVHDWTTGYRAIRKSVFLAVGKEMEAKLFAGYTFQIGFLHKAIRKGFVVREVPIQFVDRVVGESKLGTDYIKNALWYVLSERYAEVISSHIFKFGVVGGIGFLINASLLALLSAPAIGIEAGNASAIGAEVAIISNFILNNYWTFSERRESRLLSILRKFGQFNFASLGAVIIQKVLVSVGTAYTSDSLKFFWFVMAVGIGMVLNYIIYSRVIWKKR